MTLTPFRGSAFGQRISSTAATIRADFCLKSFGFSKAPLTYPDASSSPLKQSLARENPRRLEGVQRRGPVQGAVSARSSQTFNRTPLEKTPSFKRRGLSGGSEEDDFSKIAAASRGEEETVNGSCRHLRRTATVPSVLGEGSGVCFYA
jgi:hypothetical protein